MIDQLTLRNFKCFADQSLLMKPLTVLCGLNGVGKSSVVQSLLIVQQAIGTIDKGIAHIPLNGLFGLELGTVSDIYCHFGNSPSIEIGVHAHGNMSRLVIDADETALQHQYLTVHLQDGPLPPSIGSFRSFEFIYLSAERLGPRDTQTTQSKPIDQMTIGARGEFAAEILSRYERDEVRSQVRHPSSTPELWRLQQQLQLWMSEWCPELQIRADRFPDTNMAAIRLRHRSVASDWMRPGNMGFGISHSLPIVLAGLLAKEHGLLIVDNPESHLHPNGQSAMGRFLATVAASGVQVVVETHSDHILNGIRLAAAHPSHPLRHSDVAIYHSSFAQEGVPAFDLIEVTDSGGLTNWPIGFFDQTERDLAELSKLRKRHGQR